MNGHRAKERKTETRSKQATNALIAARDRIQDCLIHLRNYADSDENLEHAHGRDEMLEQMREHLATLVARAIRSTTVLLELLDLPETLTIFRQDLTQFADQHSAVEYFDEFIGVENPVVEFLRGSLESVAPLFEDSSVTLELRGVALKILRGLPRYLELQNTLPGKEHDVQNALHGILGLAFPDVIREAAAPKQTKSYHPDFAINSIRTAIEVKFAKDEVGAKTAVGALYEDMHGYANSSWAHFIGFIYMAGNFLTEDQVKAELAESNAPKEWSVVVVTGHTKPTIKKEQPGVE